MNIAQLKQIISGLGDEIEVEVELEENKEIPIKGIGFKIDKENNVEKAIIYLEGETECST